MDEHIHLAITVGLQFRDVDVLTVQDDGRKGMPDTVILDRAMDLQRVVFTQDEDFSEYRATNPRNRVSVRFYASSRDIHEKPGF